ncbi:PIN domain-containing protein [Paremcibacter congregatus]|uniref:PIN domain-containing protein n=1 Tax=Paremcibacter congregatus TaxID=2043170 RepID=UPI003A93609D
MNYDAITIDTNVIKAHGYRFDHGLLAQLAQFRESPYDFLLSEIIVRETRKHLIKRSEDLRDRFTSAARSMVSSSMFGSADQAQLTSLMEGLGSAEQDAENKLQSFISMTGAEIIPIDGVGSRILTDMYFDITPPFEDNVKKRKEFPDAMALLSLSDWAKTNDKRLLVISEDSGWKSFADNNARIDVKTDLAEALAAFQENIDKARELINRYVTALFSKDGDALKSEICDMIADQVAENDITLEADSYVNVEVETGPIELEGFYPANISPVDSYSIVRISADEIVVQLSVDLGVNIDYSASFYTVDGIDKDYVSLGSEHAVLCINIDAKILITLSMDSLDSDAKLEVLEAEIVDAEDYINLGYLEPFGDED